MGLAVWKATAGGFAGAAGGSAITYPKVFRARHVRGMGLNTLEQANWLTCPCATATSTLFVSGTSFTADYAIATVTLNVYGRIGERRPYRI